MDTKQQALLNHITIKTGLMGGRPMVRGLRFPVSDLLELLASGLTEEELLEQHPHFRAIGHSGCSPLRFTEDQKNSRNLCGLI